MKNDKQTHQDEPAEVDRATIERELARSETNKEAAEQEDRSVDNRPVKSFDPKSPGRRIFGNGDTDR